MKTDVVDTKGQAFGRHSINHHVTPCRPPPPFETNDIIDSSDMSAATRSGPRSDAVPIVHAALGSSGAAFTVNQTYSMPCARLGSEMLTRQSTRSFSQAFRQPHHFYHRLFGNKHNTRTRGGSLLERLQGLNEESTTRVPQRRSDTSSAIVTLYRPAVPRSMQTELTRVPGCCT